MTAGGGGAVLIVLLLVLFSVVTTAEEKKTWVPVVKKDFDMILTETGNIISERPVLIEAPMEHRMELQIIDMTPEGTFVNQGDFILQYDTSTLEEQLEVVRDYLEQAESDLARVIKEQETRMSGLEINLQIAVLSREAAEVRQEQLKFEAEVRKEEAKLEYQKALLSYSDTETQIAARKVMDYRQLLRAQLSVEQRKENVSDLEQRIKSMTVTAPISGMLVYREIGGRGTPKHKVQIGDKPMPGEAVLSIPDLTNMKMTTQIHELDISTIEVGQNVTIRLDAFEDTLFTGKVETVARLVENKEDPWLWFRRGNTNEQFREVPTFIVSIAIEGSDSRLKPGMTAQAKIVLDTVKDATVVPVGGVFEDVEGNPVVFTKKRYPDSVPVTIGDRNSLEIVVLDGIEAGDEITLDPPAGAYPLGWYTDMEMRREELDTLIADIDTMNEQGIVNDVEERAAQKKLQQDQPAERTVDESSWPSGVQMGGRGGRGGGRYGR